ncbi:MULTISPECIES: hypothetical protein [Agrobacterium]|jgi:hypothetical protein|nr:MULTISPECIES: hypothetical protein [Agrobacterium]MBM7321801.1 hypothetical protein [Agrobacterium sp. S2]MDR6192375.1 hypothetical protein [Agrobacterium pusense]
MSERTDEKSIYWTIVGADTNTNEGLARLLGAILIFTLIGGFLVWLLAG